jgi:DNA invertase Pin-like site-specific DNA recombinase
LDGISLDRIFEDKASGKDTQERPQLQAALSYLRAGDILIIHSMDRLARNLSDLRKIVGDLTKRGVSVQFVKEGQTFTGDDTPIAVLMLSLMGAFAEFERAMIRERQREGIAIAKAKGVYQGRKRALTAEQEAALQADDSANGHRDRAALARKYGISRETLYRTLGRLKAIHVEPT